MLFSGQTWYVVQPPLDAARGRAAAAALSQTFACCGRCGRRRGVDSILEREDLRSQPARAITFVEVSCISRENLIATVNSRVSGDEGAEAIYPIAAVRVPRSHTTDLRTPGAACA